MKRLASLKGATVSAALLLGACAGPATEALRPAGTAQPATLAAPSAEAERYLRRHLVRLALDRYRAGRRLPDELVLDRATAVAMLKQLSRQGPTVTWIGHSSFLLTIGGLNVLTDPVYSPRATPLPPLGPRRLAPPGLPFAALPRIDAILISHSHYDHLDYPTLARLAGRDRRTMVFAPPGARDVLRRAGFKRIVEGAPFQAFRPGGATVTAMPVRHPSGRGLPQHHGDPSRAWLIEANGLRIFFAGDTGYSPVFAAARRRIGPVDIALVPIGAYEPQRFEAPHHVTPEDAVRIARDLGAGRAIAMHWGKFALTPEPILEPPRRFLAADVPGLDRDVLRIGETVSLR